MATTTDAGHAAIGTLWSAGDLAEHLGVPLQTIYVWRTKGRGPRAIRVGKFIRFDPQDVATWLEQLKDPAA